jgi:hypothetical protein
MEISNQSVQNIFDGLLHEFSPNYLHGTLIYRCNLPTLYNFLLYLEFQNAHCLFISELNILLEAQRESKDHSGENRPQTK